MWGVDTREEPPTGDAVEYYANTVYCRVPKDKKSIIISGALTASMLQRVFENAHNNNKLAMAFDSFSSCSSSTGWPVSYLGV